jgi:catechol 2,3-dioxygenase-like lactoylglutathione lyase family enzyme
VLVGLGHVDLVCRDLERSRFTRPCSGRSASRRRSSSRASGEPEYYATFFLDPDGFRLEVATSRDAR